MADYTLNIIVQGEDRASGPLNGIGGALGNMAQVAGGIIGADIFGNLADGFKGAVAGAAEFEAGMNRFGSVTGLAQQQLGEFSALFLELGATTQFSAAQAQQAAIELAKGGIQPAVLAAGGLSSAMALAAAGELDLAEAAGIAAKQLGTWVGTAAPAGEQAAFLAQSADLLAQAANASTVDVAELGLGMANVGGIAKTMGLGFGETVQTMALLAPGFSSAADAGTSLKVMLSRLQPTTTAAKEAFHAAGLMAFDSAAAFEQFGINAATAGDPMEELDAAMRQYITSTMGVQQGTKAFDKAYTDLYSSFEYSKFYDAQGSFLGMENASQVLKDGLNGMSEAQKTATLQAMFGQDAFRAGAMLAEQGATGYNNMGAAMANAGSAMEQAAARNQGFAFAMDSLKGTIETLAIVLGGMVLPALTNLVNVFNQGLGIVLSFAQGAQLTATQIAAFGVSLNGIVPGLGTFVAGILASSNPMAALVSAIDAAVPGFAAFAAFLGQAAAAAQPLIAALGANLVPILIGVAAVIGGVIVAALASMAAGFLAAVAPIAALVAAGALLYSAWSTNFLGIQTVVMGVIGAIVPYVQAGIAQISAFWQAHGAEVVGFIQTSWAQIGSIIAGVLQLVGSIVQTQLSGITAFVNAHGAEIQTVLEGAWMMISGTIGAALALVQGVIQAALAAISGEWGTAWAILVETAGAVFANLGTVVAGALQIVQTYFAMVWAAIAADLQAAGAAILAAWDGMVAGLVAGAAALGAGIMAGLGQLGAMVAGVFAQVQGAVDAAWGAISAAFAAGAAAIAAVWAGIWAMLPADVQTNLSAIGAIVAEFWGILQSLFAAGMALVAALVQTGIAQVQTAFAAGWAMLAAVTQTAWAQVAQVVQAAWAVVVAAVQAGVALVTSAVQTGFAAVAQAAGAAWALIAPAIASAWGAILGAVNVGIAAIRGAWATFAAAAANLGRDLIAGIARGVSAGMSVLTNAVKNAAQSALNAAKSMLGIHSPSRVFADQVGAPMAQGVAAGFSAAAPQINTAIKSGLVDALGKIAGIVDQAAAAFGRLGSFKGGNGAGIAAFGESVAQVVQTLVNVAAQFTGPALKSAVAFSEAAGKVMQLISSGVDALQKLQGFVGPTINAIGNFGAALSDAFLYVLVVANQFSTKAIEHAGKFAESAGKVVQLISSGVDAFEKLQGFKGVTESAFKIFAACLDEAYGYIEAISQKFSLPAIEHAAKFAESGSKVVALIGTGVDAFAKLQGFTGVSWSAISAFANTLVMVVAEIAKWATAFTGEALTHAAKFSEAAQKIVAMVGGAVEALGKLASFKPVEGSQIHIFTHGIVAIVGSINLWATAFTGEALTHAQKFAESAGKIAALVGTAVDNLAKLAGFKPVQGSQIHIFTMGIVSVVGAIAQWATAFTGPALDHAQKFAEAGGKIVSLIGTGVDALGKLAEYRGTPAAATQAFAADISTAIGLLAQVAAQFSAEALAHAQKFAESAGKTVSMIGTGVDALTKLGTYQGIAATTIGAFAADLGRAIAALAQVANAFTAEALAHAQKFADSAGKSVQMIGTGVDALTKLGTFQGVAPAAISAFTSALQAAMAQLAAAANAFTAEAIAHAQKFSEAAGKSVQMIGTGVDALTKLGTFKAPAQAAISAFGATLQAAMAQLAAIAGQFSVETLAQAQKFSESAGKAVSMIGTGVDALAKLADFKAPAQAAISAFGAAIQAAYNTLATIANQYTAEAIGHSQRFAEGAGKVLQLVGTGVDQLNKLGSFKGINTEALNSFAASVHAVVATLTRLADQLSGEAVSKAQAFAEAAGRIVELVKQTMDAMRSLGGSSGGDGGAGAVFGAVVKFGDAIGGAADKTRAALGVMLSALQAAGSSAGSILNSIVDQAKQAAEGMAQAMSSAGEQMKRAAEGSMQAIRSAVESGFAGVVSAARSAMADVEAAIRSGFAAAADAARGAMADILSAVRSGFADIAGAARAAMAEVTNAIRSGFAAAAAAARSAMGEITSAVRSGFSAIGSAATAAQGPIRAFGSTFTSVAGGISRSASSAAGAVSSMAGRIASSASSASTGLSRLSSAIKSVPKMPAVSIPKAPSIPGFASGTRFAPGGLSLVGERGPELVNLPRGSRVYPNRQSMGMLAGGAGTTNNFYFEGRESRMSKGEIKALIAEALAGSGRGQDIRRRMSGG